MSNSYLDRAVLLIQQDRYELAVAELRKALAEDPSNPRIHAALAWCLVFTQDFDSAERAARQAVSLAPDNAHSFYVLAQVLVARRHPEEAASAVQEAIRLNPEDADHHALLAKIRLEQSRWKDALAAADAALALDPEHVESLNAKTVAQVKLRQRTGAAESVEAALQQDPNNPLTHANLGWLRLEQNRPREAATHFREALRLEPGMEWARQGILHAMRARNPLYRLMLKYFLFMGRLTKGMQWAFIIGLYVVYQLVRGASENHPEWAPFLTPLLVAYVSFAVFTWIAEPVYNLILRLDRFGRLVLSRAETLTANVVGFLLLAALLCLAGSLFGHQFGWLVGAFVFASMIVPVSRLKDCDRGWPRQMAIAYTAVMGSFGLVTALGLSVLPRLLPEVARETAMILGLLALWPYVLVAIASMFVFNWLPQQQVRR